MMKSLSVADLAQWLGNEARAKPVLLDVREPWEQQICAIPGSLAMPMQTVPSQFGSLDPDQPIVCVCHHGGRSMQVAMYLLRQGCQDVYNLSGGVDAWARQVDPSMPTY